MSAKYIQKGEVIDYTNSGNAAIKAGDVVSLTTRIGVAAGKIAAGAVGALHTVGVFKVNKPNDEAFTIGQKIFYDESESKFTGTANGNIPAGWAIMVAQTTATEALVCISDLVGTSPVSANVGLVSATNGTAAAGDAPTKAEYDVVVSLANANKTAVNAVIATLISAGLMAAE